MSDLRWGRPDLVGVTSHQPPPPVPEGVVPLGANEVPWGPPAAVIAAVAAAAGTLNRYADDAAIELRTRLTGRVDAPIESLAVGCGSLDLCRRAVFAACRPGDEVVFAWPSFVEYPLLARQAGAVARAVPLVDHRHDLTAMAAAITDRTRVVFVCQPNSPTGTVVSETELACFIDDVPPQTLVVIDEAYKEFAGGSPTALHGVIDRPNALVLRTFSKAFALAGLRVGYAVGRPDVVDVLDRVRLTYAVSHLAQIGALAALVHESTSQALVGDLIVRRDRLADALRARGFEIPASHANHLFVVGERAGLTLARALEQVHVRASLVAGFGLRITVGDTDHDERVVAAATSVADRRGEVGSG